MELKQLTQLVFVVVLVGAISCTATTYIVGDSSGWDISSDLDTWTTDKTFTVGDVLVFQYSSSHSVSEVTREGFDGCNTTVTLKTYSDGNTSIPLTKAGEMYFVCGNKLHCLGGMKLQVNVEQDQATASSPADAPQAATGGSSDPTRSLTRPSSKSNNPSAVIPTSDGFSIHGGIRDSNFVLASLGFMTTLLLMVKF